MECALSQAAFSYLWDHRVAAQALFPAAAMLEAAAAAAAAMLAAAQGPAAVHAATLTGVSIPAPLVLPAAHSAAALVLSVTAGARSGTLSVGSSAAGGRAQVHLRAAACVCTTAAEALLGTGIQQPSALAELLSGQAKSGAAARPLAVATACVQQDPRRQQGEQYLIHPVVLDNCTQAGAAFAAPDESAASQRVTRVPAGLAAFAAGGRVRASACHASAAFVGLLNDGSAVSDYQLRSGADSAPGLAITGMLFKPVSRTMMVQQRPEAGAAASAAADALYEICWAVKGPADTFPGVRLAKRSLLWEAGHDSARLRVRLAKKSSSTVPALASSLRFIQAQLSATRPATALHSHGSLHAEMASMLGGETAFAAAAGAAGLLKVAAQEHPAARWQHCMQHQSAAASRAEVSASADAFGSGSSAGAQLAPRMQHASPPVQPITELASLIGRAVIVTGGLGSIGSLVSARIAVSSPGARMHLLSRTGHSQMTLPAAIAHAEGTVSISSCDASQRCDVAELARRLGEEGMPLGAVYHAGGVLQDALLPRQVHTSLLGAK